MSSEPQVPSQLTGTTNSLTEPPKKPRSVFFTIVLIVALSVGFISDIGEVRKKLFPELSGAAAAAEINRAAAGISGMFSVPSEVFEEFQACNYKYLFFCEPKPGVAKCPSRADDESEWEVCVSVVTAPDFGAPAVAPRWWESIPVVNLAVLATVMLPRLPDAGFQMLKVRWSQGPLEFQQGLLFLFIYFTLLVVALRQKPGNLWYFVVTLVYGPYLIIGIFWLLQRALAHTSPSTIMHTGEATWGAGTAWCYVICAWHDLESIGEEMRRLIKASRVLTKAS